MAKRITILLAVGMTGCAANPPHPYMSKPIVLGPPQYQCDLNGNCELVQMWEPSQLTPFGCVLNQWAIGFSKKALECKKPKETTK